MNTLVHPKEKFYFAICLVFSVLLYILLIISVVGLVYIIGGVVLSLFVHGVFVGQLRGNGIRVTDRQFPEIHRLTEHLAHQMEMKVPAVYVLQAGGLLNAFASRFLGRDFVVLYSDVLEVAYSEGEPALAFILAHELAHIKRAHLRWRMVLYPAMLIPFLGGAYSRACEYTCDRFGAHFRPDGAVKGLLLLAAGKMLYKRVDATDYSRQAEAERGFWVSFAEILSTHPNLAKRVDAVAWRAAKTASSIAESTAYSLQ